MNNLNLGDTQGVLPILADLLKHNDNQIKSISITCTGQYYVKDEHPFTLYALTLKSDFSERKLVQKFENFKNL